jgi:hypothetical protein
MAGSCAHVEFLKAQLAWALAAGASSSRPVPPSASHSVSTSPSSAPARTCVVATAPRSPLIGATDGIGCVIAIAELGLVLVSRNREKLVAMAIEIQGLDVRVLVNNAGVSCPYARRPPSTLLPPSFPLIRTLLASQLRRPLGELICVSPLSSLRTNGSLMGSFLEAFALPAVPS